MRILGLLLALAALPRGGCDGQSAWKDGSESILKPWMFLSSKTPYYSQQLGDRERMPPQCRLVHINHIGAQQNLAAPNRRARPPPPPSRNR